MLILLLSNFNLFDFVFFIRPLSSNHGLSAVLPWVEFALPIDERAVYRYRGRGGNLNRNQRRYVRYRNVPRALSVDGRNTNDIP